MTIVESEALNAEVINEMHNIQRALPRLATWAALSIACERVAARSCGYHQMDATIVALRQMQAEYYRNLNQPLAACVTTRELPGTAEPQKIYGRRGAEASLDGGRFRRRAEWRASWLPRPKYTSTLAEWR